VWGQENQGLNARQTGFWTIGRQFSLRIDPWHQEGRRIGEISIFSDTAAILHRQNPNNSNSFQETGLNARIFCRPHP
jgi:hypothetical protein